MFTTNLAQKSKSHKSFAPPTAEEQARIDEAKRMPPELYQSCRRYTCFRLNRHPRWEEYFQDACISALKNYRGLASFQAYVAACAWYIMADDLRRHPHFQEIPFDELHGDTHGDRNERETRDPIDQFVGTEDVPYIENIDTTLLSRIEEKLALPGKYKDHKAQPCVKQAAKKILHVFAVSADNDKGIGVDEYGESTPIVQKNERAFKYERSTQRARRAMQEHLIPVIGNSTRVRFGMLALRDATASALYELDNAARIRNVEKRII